jgi:CheY-like chemotaxis protein
MQGAELVAEIRADARISSIPIVLLAPSELHAERVRGEGLDGLCCLLKPVSVAALLELIVQVDSLGVALVTDAA